MQIASLWPAWPGQNQFINTKFTRPITKISKPSDRAMEKRPNITTTLRCIQCQIDLLSCRLEDIRHTGDHPSNVSVFSMAGHDGKLLLHCPRGRQTNKTLILLKSVHLGFFANNITRCYVLQFIRRCEGFTLQ